MINQIEKVLPRSAWDAVTIYENGEALVRLKETSKLKLGGVHKVYEPLFLLRETVAEKLYKIANSLPDRIVLVIIEGYRTLQHQQDSWDRSFKKLKEDHLDWSDEQIEKQVRLVVARPHPLANHHCGGAVDVTLMYENEEFLDMGSPYPSEGLSMEIRKKFPMFPNTTFNRVITMEHQVNRRILRVAMETQDFVWYPGEWWHYCYGDRMWAVYTNQTECVYGPVEL